MFGLTSLGIVHTAMGENVGNRMPHRLADAQLPLRAAGSGAFFLVVTRHYRFLKTAAPARQSGDHVFLFNRDRARRAGTGPALAPWFNSLENPVAL